MTGQPSAVDVLREHFQNAITWEHEERVTGWCCTCGERGPGDHREHIGDMLAAAGLLATPERLAQERAVALGEAAEAVGYQDWAGQEHNAETWLSARAEAERAGGGT